jgi:hypothetical protein
MPINSRQKGKRGELELAHVFLDHGLLARRGQQYSGIGGDDVVVQGHEDWHIECKWVQNLNVVKAMEQAVRDAKGRTPLLAHRKNGTDWLMTMRIEDWLELVKKGQAV